MEEKPTIRNQAGILFWRPAFVFLGGRTGPGVSDGKHTGFADHKGRIPDMYEAAVRATWCAAHMGMASFAPYDISFAGNYFQRPVLSEEMCKIPEFHPDRLSLCKYQVVTQSLAWSRPKTGVLKDSQEDIG